MTDTPAPIYLDYAATTPVDPHVASAMHAVMTGSWGNPSSAHGPGKAARRHVERAREQVAQCLGCASDEIVFTASATESINTALGGLVRGELARGQPAHVITTRIEHPATLELCRQLEREGAQVLRLEPDAHGTLAPERLAAALRDDTTVVSVTHANGEVGTLLDLPRLAAVCAEREVPMHVDAAQSAGKVALDLSQLPVDLMSISGHKVYGPKGVGALFVRRRPRRVLLQPLLFGGGQEARLRSGTLATHQIVGLGEALVLAEVGREAEQERLRTLRDQLWGQLQKLGGVHLNGHPTRRLGGHLSVSIEGVEGESLLLELEDLAVSRGSACSALTGDASYVLRALGRDDVLAGSTLRLTLGRPTTEDEVGQAGQRIREAVSRLRALAPREGCG